MNIPRMLQLLVLCLAPANQSDPACSTAQFRNGHRPGQDELQRAVYEG